MSKQEAASDPSNINGNKSVCQTVKGAHVTCQIVAKVGQKVVSDSILVMNNQGEEKCTQSRVQDKKDPTKVTRRDNNERESQGNDSQRNRRTSVRMDDKRKGNAHIKTTVAR